MLHHAAAFVVALWPGAVLAAEQCPAQPAAGLPQLTITVSLTIVCHDGYVSAVDNAAKVPRWVAYTLTADAAASCDPRTDNFHRDPALPADSASPSDYHDTGYDLGHQAPAADFAGQQQTSDSFSMANMAPQIPGLNREGWEGLEQAVREWAVDRGPLAVYTGPVLYAQPTSIGEHHVAVPSMFWKVIADRAGEVIAFEMPNAPISKGDLTPYLVPIDQISRAASITFPFDASATAVWPSTKAWAEQHAAACQKRKE